MSESWAAELMARHRRPEQPTGYQKATAARHAEEREAVKVYRESKVTPHVRPQPTCKTAETPSPVPDISRTRITSRLTAEQWDDVRAERRPPWPRRNPLKRLKKMVGTLRGHAKSPTYVGHRKSLKSLWGTAPREYRRRRGPP